MARKTEIVTVPVSGWGARDAGKMFLLTEKSAMEAQKWGTRAFLAIQNSQERIPEGIADLGMVGVAIVGLNVLIRGSIDPAVLFALMDDLMACVQIIRDARHPDVATAIVSDDDIEETQTRFWLQSEVIRLHTNFSPADAFSTLISAIQTKGSSTT